MLTSLIKNKDSFNIPKILKQLRKQIAMNNPFGCNDAYNGSSLNEADITPFFSIKSD